MTTLSVHTSTPASRFMKSAPTRFAGSANMMQMLTESTRPADLDLYEERTDISVPQIYNRVINQKQNLLLHGSEGCGKSMLISKAMQAFKARGIPVFPFNGKPLQCVVEDDQLTKLENLLDALQSGDKGKVLTAIEKAMWMSSDVYESMRHITQSGDKEASRQLLKDEFQADDANIEKLKDAITEANYPVISVLVKSEQQHDADYKQKAIAILDDWTPALNGELGQSPPLVMPIEELISGIISKESMATAKPVPKERWGKDTPTSLNNQVLMMSKLYELQQKYPNLRLVASQERTMMPVLDFMEGATYDKEKAAYNQAFPEATSRIELQILDNMVAYLKKLLPKAGFFVKPENWAILDRYAQQPKAPPEFPFRKYIINLATQLKELAKPGESGSAAQRVEDPTIQEEITPKMLGVIFPTVFDNNTGEVLLDKPAQ